MAGQLIANPPPRLRQRRRTDGTWRIWWEPEAAVRAMGFATVDLDAGKLTWSVRQAAKLNADVDRARASGGRAVPPAGGRTLSALIDVYRRSSLWSNLAPKTQADYAARLRLIEAKWGGSLVSGFSKPVMHTWHETLIRASGPWQAVAQIRVMSILFSYAELAGWRPEGSNPCLRLRMSVPDPRSRSASWAEFDALMAAADRLGMPGIAAAIALAALHGQRQTDVRTARLDGFRLVDGRLVWFLRRSKRQNLGAVPVHPDALPRVRALIAAAVPGQTALILDHATGQPLSEDLFQKRWAAVRAAAARVAPSVAGLQFRDLRRTFGVWARAGGATMADVGDVLGNSVAADPRLEETYTPATLDTTARAVAAVARPKSRKAGNE